MGASYFIVVSGRLADDELGGGAADAVDVDTGRHAVGVDDDVAVAGLQCHLLDELAVDAVPQDLVERLEEHLDAGLDDDD